MSSRVSSAALIAVHTCRRCLYNRVSVTPHYLLTGSQTTTSHTHTRLHSSSVSAELESPVYDVVISGGGMVGTAAAAAFGSSRSMKNKRILLLESAPYKTYKPPQAYSNRVSAISPSSKQLLQDVGAWDLLDGRYQPVKSMYVWDACSDAKITFNKPKEPEDYLAYLVQNDLLVDCLYTISKTYDNIGADGFKSLTRQSVGIDIVSWNYDQVGVVATLKLDKQECGNHTAWQRFLPTGPIAVLPLSDEYSSLVWSTTRSQAKHLLSLSAESFVDELNQSLNDTKYKDSLVTDITNGYSDVLKSLNLESLLGSGTHTDGDSSEARRLPPTIIDIESESRAVFPFGLMHADQYVAPRLALVGDACHRIHPLAGQGVNLGFGDVECLVRNVTEAAELGVDVGWIDHLVSYESERQRHNVTSTAGIDSLYRLYSTQFTPLVLARSIGLATVNALNPIKNFFTKHAQA